MAVPNTDTFTLDDVLQELGLGDGDSLQDCFDDATSSSFDTNYNPNSDGTDNNLLNFRNYGGTQTTTLTVAQSPVSGGSSHVDLGNQSTSSQNISYTWEYVSQSGGSGVDVQYGGVTRSPGYVTPTITSSFNANQYKPFTFGSGGYNTTVYFKFTLISATADIVPSSPNNSANTQTLILL
jgi:hypothetical protein